VKKKIVVVIAAILLLFGASIGMNAQNSICGISGAEFGIQADLCSSSAKMNIGVLPSLPGLPILWFGLTFTDFECKLLAGPYFKIGIPGFDVARFQYLTNEWRCFSRSSRYMEIEMRIPLCLSGNVLRVGNVCFPYLGLGYYKESCGSEQTTPIIGLTHLWYNQGRSAGVWIEATLYKIETGFTFGLWSS